MEQQIVKISNIKNKNIIIVILGILAIGIAAGGLVFLLIFAKHSTKEKTHGVCTTVACVKAAEAILNSLDTSVDPCHDFHQFSCGSFVKLKRIPDEVSKIDLFEILRTKLANEVADLLASELNSKDVNATRNAKKLFHSCVNENLIQADGERKFLKVLQYDLQGWPILNQVSLNDTISNQTTATSIVHKMVLLRKYGFRTLIDVHVTLNPKDPQTLILKVKQPSWFFNKHYYNDTNFIAAYKQYMRKYILNFNKTLSFIETAPSLVESSVERMFNIEKTLAFHLTNEDQKRNTNHTNMSVRLLTWKIPKFDWKEFIIEGIFSNLGNMTVTLDEMIIVEDFSYLLFVADLIDEYEKKDSVKKNDLINLMIWSAVKNEIAFLPKKFKDTRQEFDQVSKGTVSYQSRNVTCAHLVLDLMEFAVGRLYVAKHFSERSKLSATEMIENIRQEFMETLREAEWLDTVSKERALDKAANLDIKVGYPDFIYNDSYMDQIYNYSEMNENEFLDNMFQLLKQETIRSFKELKTRRNRKNWISGPAVVNAFYSPFSNQICILQAPFYDVNYPNYLNYGGIGSVIGHEITHGFDDRGRLHDKNGVFYADGTTGLWTNTSVQNYKQKIKCIVEQYTDYYVKQINKTINGFLTQDENIADNVGIKQSFRAYRKWVSRQGKEELLLPGLLNYNQNQLFFINYAQVWCTKYRYQSLLYRILNSNHSPGEYRIIGPTSNSEVFSQVFRCKKGQRNNPERKCSIW